METDTPKLEYISPSSNVTSGVSSVTSGVSDAVSGVTSAASSGVSSVTSGVSDAVSGVTSAASSGVSSVTSGVSSAIESSGIGSFFDFSTYTAYDILRVFAIILILSFLGINFFGYLGKVTETIRDFLKPILVFIGYGAAETTKSIVTLSAEGTKGAVDVASGAVVGGVNLLEKGLSKKGATMNKIDDHSKIDMKLLEKAVQKQNQPQSEDQEPEPDEAGSRTQASKMKIKSGFCYIGEDRGFRRCIAVGEGDKCLSGDIFPTDEICVNPSLRE
jgi:hypothetical protein